MKLSFKQKLTGLLTGLLMVMIIAIGGFLYVNRFISKPLKINDIQIDSSAALKLNLLKQVSKKDGIREWELTAVSATLLKDEDKAVLENVTVYFFTKDNKTVDLTSDTGTLNTKTHDMTFTDNVVVIYVTAILRTDKLHYDKKEHIISTDSRVRLEKDGSFIEADSMTIHLNDNKLIFKGHVKGNFNENFHLQFQ